MTSLGAASSDTESCGQSDPSRPTRCQQPRSYVLVFAINATVMALLWPADADFGFESCGLAQRFFFVGLMLSGFGAGCVAAFLARRAGASSHTRSACGYAIINWLEAMLGSLGMHNPNNRACRYGVIPAPSPFPGCEGAVWYVALASCRMLLYLTALLWMQMLIASRLDLLEKSSNRSFRGGCFRRLLWVQGAAVACAIPFAVMIALMIHEGISIGYRMRRLAESFGLIFRLVVLGVGSIALLCNMTASSVAIVSSAVFPAAAEHLQPGRSERGIRACNVFLATCPKIRWFASSGCVLQPCLHNAAGSSVFQRYFACTHN